MYEPVRGAFCAENKEIRGRAHGRYLLELPSLYCCSSGYNCTLHFVMGWVFRVEFYEAVQYNWVSHPVFIQLHTAALLLPLDICTQSQSFFFT